MMFIKKYGACCLSVVLLFFFAGCSQRTTRVGESDAPQHILIEPRHVVQQPPTDSLDGIYSRLTNKNAVLTFYHRRKFQPAWGEGEGGALADSMIQFIHQAKYYGLSTSNYRITVIDSLSRHVADGRSMLQRDVLLTDAFFSVASHLRHGSATDRSDSTTKDKLEKVLQLGHLRSTLESFEPTAPGYRDLRRGLRQKLDSLAFIGPGPSAMSLNKQIRIIEINLDRWRSELINSSTYVLINIPSYMLYLVVDDAIILESAVIVGAPETPTPELNSAIESVVMYPYWHVPRKIAIEELLPKIQNDSSFIRTNNFDILDGKGHVLHPDSVDWSTFSKDYFPISLRQREGPDNSLGVVKFVFDNPYAVFLHDTNSRSLFEKKARAYSHGCVRMDKAIELAHYLVTGSLVKKSVLVDQSLNEELKRTINVRPPMPIYIRYFTCEWRDGKILFFNDVYQLDYQHLNSARGGN